ncbi:MAG: cell wall hydrolase [Lachnospiraceae bacterium]|nr:cell wall hydrolase [Lachnospiraceae bacterium]
MMYKRAVAGLVLVNLLFLVSFLCVRGFEINFEAVYSPVNQLELDESIIADKTVSAIGIADVAASGQRVVDCNILEKENELIYELCDEDIEALCRIVEAEAGSEDDEGKLLVANVVLNRVEDESFPDTVTEVIFQTDKGVAQFSPVSNGRYYEVTISEETREAVERALSGEDISEGALYFVARGYADSSKMSWFEANLEYLFNHGGHEFYTTD